jgi:hypothetical protein
MTPSPGRRRLALPSLLGIALALAWPPFAAPASADNLAIVIDGPSDGHVVEDGSTVTVSGRVATGLLTSVDGITVQLFTGGSLIHQESACAPCGSDSTVSFSHTLPELDYNGRYQVRVTATGFLITSGIPVDPDSAEVGFAVAVPPEAPTNVTASHADGKVTVTWRAVPAYPDLVGYVVYRRSGASAFAPASAGLAPGTTSFVDAQLPPGGGNLQYRVVAIRGGADEGASNWLTAESAAVPVSVPAPPTTVPPGPGGTTSTLPPGGGLQSDGAVNSLGSLGSLFPSATGVQFPTATSTPGLPDTGFTETLPFGVSPELGNKVEGRQAGRSASSSGSGSLDDGDLSDSNRRALLVPVAAGSVLCVSALHLRWLNRRLAVSAAGLAGGGAGPDLEPDPDPDGPPRSSDLVRVG